MRTVSTIKRFLFLLTAALSICSINMTNARELNIADVVVPQHADVPPAQKPIPLVFSAGEWPPYLGAKLPEQGMAARLIRDIFADAGYQVRFDFLPWPRAYRDTQLGRYAASAVWMHAAERETHFYYSAPVLAEEFVLFHLKQRPLIFSQLQDLTGMELGGGLGYSYGAAFDKALAVGQFRLSRVSKTSQNFQRLVKGRIQAFPEEKQVGYHVLRTELPDLQHLITHATTPLLVNQSYVLFPKASPQSAQLQHILNEGLARYRTTGRYRQYFE
jgi:polar amino acid transport system substrate-binding protein